MQKLFDVALADAISMITIAEYRFFLDDHCGPCIGYVGSVDTTLARTEDRKVKRLKREEYSEVKEKKEKERTSQFGT